MSELSEEDKKWLRQLLREMKNRTAEKYKCELEAGPDAEREEELRAWFAHEQALNRLDNARDKREERDRRIGATLVDLPRPRFMS
jgi:hypothetical protein